MGSFASAVVIACLAAAASAVDARGILPSPVIKSRRALLERDQHVQDRRPRDFATIIFVLAGKQRQMETCDDGKLSAHLGETDVDCGGSCADDMDQLCEVGRSCSRDADCVSGTCTHDGKAAVCSEFDKTKHAAAYLNGDS